MCWISFITSARFRAGSVSLYLSACHILSLLIRPLCSAVNVDSNREFTLILIIDFSKLLFDFSEHESMAAFTLVFKEQTRCTSLDWHKINSHLAKHVLQCGCSTTVPNVDFKSIELWFSIFGLIPSMVVYYIWQNKDNLLGSRTRYFSKNRMTLFSTANICRNIHV